MEMSESPAYNEKKILKPKTFTVIAAIISCSSVTDH